VWNDPSGLLVHGTYSKSTGMVTLRDQDSGQVVRYAAESGGKPFGDPIPNGTYEILERKGRPDFFRLDPLDENLRDDRDDVTGRDRFRLHKPGRTIGCIAAKDAGDWGQARDMIEATRTQTVPDNFKPWFNPWAKPGEVRKFGTLTVLP